VIRKNIILLDQWTSSVFNIVVAVLPDPFQGMGGAEEFREDSVRHGP